MILTYLLFALDAPVFAQSADTQPLSGLFFSGGARYYLFPSEPFEKTMPGLWLGGGWEFPVGPGDFALGLEAGWMHTGLTGDSRPADSAEAVSFALRANYGFYLGDAWKLRLDILGGGLMIITEKSGLVPFAGARLAGEYRLSAAQPLSSPIWSVFVGAGVDMMPQISGIIFQPVIEAGVKLRLNRSTSNRQKKERQKAQKQAQQPETTKKQETTRQEEAQKQAQPETTKKQEPEATKKKQEETQKPESTQKQTKPPSFDDMQAAINRMYSVLGDIQLSVDSMYSSLASMISALGDLQAGLDDIGLAADEMIAASNNIQSDLDTIQSALKSIYSALDRIQPSSNAERLALNKMRSASDTLQSTLNNTQTALNNVLSALEGIRSGLSSLHNEQETAEKELLSMAGEKPVWVTLEDGRQGVVLQESTLYFQPDSASLTRENRDKLTKFAKLLRRAPQTHIAVMGFAAAVGADKSGLAISQQRAKAVANYLIENGVRMGRIEQQIYGGERPAAPNDTPEGRAMNRRVELIFLKK